MNKTLENIRELSKIEFLPILSEECEKVLVDLMKNEKPTKILEIGTCVGYSSSIMLLNSNATIETIELDKERLDVAKSVWTSLNLQDRVTSHLGDANELLKDIVKDKIYDFVFLDGPKSRYLEHFNIVFDSVKKGGIILADDVLFFGLVNGPEHVEHKHRTIVRHLREFFAELKSRDDIEMNLLEEGNGIAIIRKK